MAMAACASLVACASSMRSGRVRLNVSVAPDANADRPIPVDVVFVWNKQTEAKVGELASKDWFGKKEQLRREDPGEKTFTVHEWEWVPGQAVPEIDLAIPAAKWRHLRAVFVFANYPTEGLHRFRLTLGATAVLALLKDDMRLQESAVSRSR